MIFSFHSVAQSEGYTVSGRVMDEKSRAPLVAASVFAQNTTIGVLTDSNGHYEIQLPSGGYSLTVTYTGYETETKRVSANRSQNDINFELTQIEKSLDEISIVFTPEVKDGWEKYGDIFLKNFIGQTLFSSKCVLTNPEALHFYYSKKHKTLKVLADTSLIVANYALGYHLTFTIDSFINNFEANTILFVGYPRFEEMDGTIAQKNIWQKNRFSIYYGSLLHFMRSLYRHNLQEDGFELKFLAPTHSGEIPVNFKNPYEALNFSKSSAGIVSLLPMYPEVAVIYHRASPEVAYLVQEPALDMSFQISTLVFPEKEVTHLESNGYYFDQMNIITNGYLGFKKIADRLPYDYYPLSEKSKVTGFDKINSVY